MKARDNPLRIERILQVRFRLEAIEAGLTLAELVERWENKGRRGAIIGPHGHGKTTLLEDLGEVFAARGETILNLRLSREKRRFTYDEWRQIQSAAPQTIILFDGAEQLNRLDWARFKKRSQRAKGIVITSHRAGLLPTLLECQTSPQLLRALLQQILGNDALAWDVECEVLWERHKGDLRLALREIYDIYAAQEGASAKIVP